MGATATATGVQLTATLSPHQTGRWFSSGWDQDDRVLWWVLPTTVSGGEAPQLSWEVTASVDGADAVTYWLTVTNLTGTTVTFEGHYTVLAS